MNYDPFIFYFVSVYSIVVLICASLILGRPLIKSWNEARVRDSVLNVRNYMRIAITAIFVLQLTALFIVAGRFVLELGQYRIFSYLLLVLFSTICLIYSITKDKLYNLKTGRIKEVFK